jgi:hypothetical protein
MLQIDLELLQVEDLDLFLLLDQFEGCLVERSLVLLQLFIDPEDLRCQLSYLGLKLSIDVLEYYDFGALSYLIWSWISRMKGREKKIAHGVFPFLVILN